MAVQAIRAFRAAEMARRPCRVPRSCAPALLPSRSPVCGAASYKPLLIALGGVPSMKRIHGAHLPPGGPGLRSNTVLRRSVASEAEGDACETGDEVEVHYTGFLDDGTQFDSTRARDTPLKFKIGSGQLMPGFDEAVLGLKIGESRKVRVEAARAFGEWREDLVARVPLEQVSGVPEVGQGVDIGNGKVAYVTKVEETEIEIDANHQLAGQALTFDVELVSRTSPMDKFPLKKSAEEWKAELSDFEFKVLRQKGTEPAGSGEYDKFYPKKGYFVCRACKHPLYTAESKFNSGCGWPAFDKCFKDSVAIEVDNSFGMRRVEILCANCGGHLGHVFEGEQMTDTNERHCVNSVSVKYVDEEVPQGLTEAKVV